MKKKTRFLKLIPLGFLMVSSIVPLSLTACSPVYKWGFGVDMSYKSLYISYDTPSNTFTIDWANCYANWPYDIEADVVGSYYLQSTTNYPQNFKKAYVTDIKYSCPSEIASMFSWNWNTDSQNHNTMHINPKIAQMHWDAFTITIYMHEDNNNTSYHYSINFAAQSAMRPWDVNPDRVYDSDEYIDNWYRMTSSPNTYTFLGLTAWDNWAFFIGNCTYLSLNPQYVELYDNSFNAIEDYNSYAEVCAGGQFYDPGHPYQPWTSHPLPPYGTYPNSDPEIGDWMTYAFGTTTDTSVAVYRHFYVEGIDNNIPDYHLQLGNPYAAKSWNKMFNHMYSLRSDLHKYFDGYSVMVPVNQTNPSGEPGEPTTTYTLTPTDVDAMVDGY